MPRRLAVTALTLPLLLGACAAEESSKTGSPPPVAAPTTPPPVAAPTTPAPSTVTTSEPTATPIDEPAPTPASPSDPGAAVTLEWGEERLFITEPIRCEQDSGSYLIGHGDPSADDEFLSIVMGGPDSVTADGIHMVTPEWMFAVDPSNDRGTADVAATQLGYLFTGTGEVRHTTDQETLEEVAYTLAVICA